MRTLVDLDDADVKSLDALAAEKGQSRAALIRKAISEFLAGRRKDASVDAFGLWGKRQIDGLEYQKSIRREW